MNIDDLPDALIVHILSFLPLQSQKATRLVSRKWCALNSDVMIMKKTVIWLRNYKMINSMLTSYNLKNIVNFEMIVPPCLKLQETHKLAQPFWKEFGCCMRSIAVVFIGAICHKVLNDMMKYCPHLQCLIVMKRNEGKKCRCTQLTDFQLPKFIAIDINLASDRFFFQNVTKNVDKLSNLQISFGDGFFSSMDSVIDLFSRCGPHLEVLGLKIRMPEISVLKILPKLSSSITELTLGGIIALTDDCLNIIKEKMVNLKKLVIESEGISYISEPILISLLLSLKNLRILHLRDDSVSDKTLLALHRLPNLKCLSITYCNVTDCGFEGLFGLSVTLKITCLMLELIDGLTDDAIIKIAPNLINLQYFYIARCNITYEAIDAIVMNCKKLKTLSVKWCPYFIVERLRPIKQLEKLQYIDFEGCLVGTYRCGDLPPRDFMVALKMASLRAVVLHCDILELFPYCKTFFSKCPNLEHVLCSNGSHMGNTVYPALSKKILGKNGKYCWEIVSVTVFKVSDRGEPFSSFPGIRELGGFANRMIQTN